MAKSHVKPLVEFLNQLEGLERLLGRDEFVARFPEFDGLTVKVRSRIRSELKKGVSYE